MVNIWTELHFCSFYPFLLLNLFVVVVIFINYFFIFYFFKVMQFVFLPHPRPFDRKTVVFCLLLIFERHKIDSLSLSLSLVECSCFNMALDLYGLIKVWEE